MKLYANIGVGHENDLDVLKQRIISAAQCNADAVVIGKSTPVKTIPKNKKYIPIQSKWGTMAYLDVAKRSEVSPENAKALTDFCDSIGIPLIWSVTDNQAGAWVREHCRATSIKIHYDAIDPIELILYCKENFDYVIYSHQYVEDVLNYYRRRDYNQFAIYYASKQFPPQIEELELGNIDELKRKYPDMTLAYESREAGIFPGVAVAYKGIDFIEKYLGDDDSDNTSILTPAQFYDFWNSMNIMFEANQVKQDGDS